MGNKLIENVETVYINTGNILSLHDITKNAGQNPTQELVEAIRITLSDFQNSGGVQPEPGQPLTVSRKNDDMASKISEHELSELKIVLKIFLNSDDESLVTSAVDKAFACLNINTVHNVIISYNQKQSGQIDAVQKIQNIWKTLESYAKQRKIMQLGLSDVEENVFKSIYDWADVKPSIIQINLATCCVVPPSLQTFCKEKEVQLLTHSDPSEILPESSIEGVFGTSLYVNWVVRFLVHIKCRGVLATKGYLLNLNKK